MSTMKDPQFLADAEKAKLEESHRSRAPDIESWSKKSTQRRGHAPRRPGEGGDIAAGWVGRGGDARFGLCPQPCISFSVRGATAASSNEIDFDPRGTLADPVTPMQAREPCVGREIQRVNLVHGLKFPHVDQERAGPRERARGPTRSPTTRQLQVVHHAAGLRLDADGKQFQSSLSGFSGSAGDKNPSVTFNRVAERRRWGRSPIEHVRE